MCLAVPAEIITVEGLAATVRVGGAEREISLALCEEARVGDFVIVHAGFALHRVEPAEAEATLALMRELVAAAGPA